MKKDQQADLLEPEELEQREGEEERWEEPGDDEWDELAEEGELPRRPRNRLLRPLPIALVVVLIAACGFLAGVLIQKGSEGSGSGAVPGGGELPAFLSEEGGATEGGEEAPAGLPAGIGGNSDAAVTGTVTSVNGSTIYVEDADGNTVAVKAQDGSTVTRDAEVGAKKIRPGDSVVVEGSTRGSTVKASSISATEAGVESGTPSFGGASGEGGESGESGEGGEGGSVESLFGE